MTYSLLLDWIGGPPMDAARSFQTALDAEPETQPVPAEQMTAAQKRAALAAGINARGERPALP